MKRKNNIFYKKIFTYFTSDKLYLKGKKTNLLLSCKQYNSIIKKSDQLLLEEKLFLNNNLTIVELAKEVGTNRTYLYKSIKCVKNQSFSQYINNNRIEYSKQLIKETLYNSETGIDNSGMTTEDYAIASGFSSGRNFVRWFKLKEGITPTQYKNALLWKVRE
ncbi:MAG: AraC family transcriptional regulator [Bacteroidales bacterium]